MRGVSCTSGVALGIGCVATTNLPFLELDCTAAYTHFRDMLKMPKSFQLAKFKSRMLKYHGNDWVEKITTLQLSDEEFSKNLRTLLSNPNFFLKLGRVIIRLARLRQPDEKIGQISM